MTYMVVALREAGERNKGWTDGDHSILTQFSNKQYVRVMGLCPQRTDDPSIQDTLPSMGHHTCAMDVCLVQRRFMRVGLDCDHSKIDQHGQHR